MDNRTVEDILKQISKNDIIHYYSNPGNAGDALIASGTFQFFDKLGVKFKFINETSFDPTNKIIFYAGGGNLNHIYKDAESFIKKIHKNAKLFVLLPHTVTANEDLLKSLGKNTILFAREEVTYKYLKNQTVNASVYIDHDMAFHLDVSRILDRKYPSSSYLILKKLLNKIKRTDVNKKIPSIKKLIKCSFYELKANFYSKYDKGIFYREDVEASGKKIPEDNADLSIIYEFGTSSREIIDYTVWRLFKHLDKFNSINTDRLHISIAGALLGKEVNFSSNSYFKCKAVYDYSLKRKFKNVHWK